MCLRTSGEVDSFKRHWEGFVIHMPKVWRKSVKHSKRKQLTEFRVNTEFWHRTRSLKSLSRSLSNIYLFIYLLFARNHQCDNHMQASMRQDSETNIIVLNTALKYKIRRIIQKTQIYQIYYIQTHTKQVCAAEMAVRYAALSVSL